MHRYPARPSWSSRGHHSRLTGRSDATVSEKNAELHVCVTEQVTGGLQDPREDPDRDFRTQIKPIVREACQDVQGSDSRRQSHCSQRPLGAGIPYQPGQYGETAARGLRRNRQEPIIPIRPAPTDAGIGPGRTFRALLFRSPSMIIQKEIQRRTRGHRDLHDLTAQLQELVEKSGIARGIASLCNIGSTAALGTIEFEPGLEEDLPAMLDRLIPPSRDYGHERRGTTATATRTSRPPCLAPA